jgi:uncharacterized surface protein with fasciclin (FAS1) repeats
MKNKLFAMIAILALVVAACSSDDDADEATTTTAAAATETTEAMVENTIVDVAINNGFTTLVAAVQAAGLVETLSGEGPFTVFAPTDEAFAALPEGTLDDLLADPEALAEILTYHVVSGEVLAADVVGLTSATTVQGSDIAIEVVDGGVVLNGSANVITTDVDASNGVVHVIDAVILPPTG